MIRVTFAGSGADIRSVTVSGHSGFAAAGSDIVCAAVTSAVRLCSAILDDAAGLGCRADVDAAAAAITLSLPSGLPEDKRLLANQVLTGLRLYLQALAEEYPENIKIAVPL